MLQYIKTYVVKHGEYENKEITLVTFDIDVACKHLINYSNELGHEIAGIEVWVNEKLLIDYGCLTIHLVNILLKNKPLINIKNHNETYPELSNKQLNKDDWIKIQNDMIKFIDKAEFGDD